MPPPPTEDGGILSICGIPLLIPDPVILHLLLCCFLALLPLHPQ